MKDVEEMETQQNEIFENDLTGSLKRYTIIIFMDYLFKFFIDV